MMNKDNTPKSKNQKNQKEAYEKMKQMGLKVILDEIAKVNSQEGLSYITV